MQSLFIPLFEDSSSLFWPTFLDIDEIAFETVSIQVELGVKNGKYVVQNVGSFEVGPRPPSFIGF